MSFQAVAIFTIGTILGFLVSLNFFLEIKSQNYFHKQMIVSKKPTVSTSVVNMKVPDLADDLFESVRILCMVMTYPPNHKTKARHVYATWGKRCNKILFVTRIFEPGLPIMLLDIPDGRIFLWNKTMGAFKSAYKYYFDDADWFFKIDDDSFVIMENLRKLLHSYDSNSSLLLGHRNYVNSANSYISGGGYILSKAALKLLVEKRFLDKNCWDRPDGMEDRAMSNCMEKDALFVDTRDELKQQRFFISGIEVHCVKNRFKNQFYWADWYFSHLYYDVPQGSLDCCSSSYVLRNSASARELYALDYFVYKVVPFGINRNFNDTLPRKFSFDEISKAAHEKSFQNHSIV